ncbi:MAG: FliO/MopB family protein [Phycisphaerae bacterium]|nr:FliO/MopB family protein [Phycisphaerae bacterium]
MAIRIRTTCACALLLALLWTGAVDCRAQWLPEISERSPTESKPLGVSTNTGARDSSAAAPGSDAGWVRTGLSLAGVIGVILLVRVALVKLSKRSGSLSLAIGAGGRSPSGVLEVLGRYPVARGQTLVLLRMDRRVLLVSQSAAGCATLTEVTDPDEVASLLVKTRDEEGASNASRFNELLHRMESDPSIVAAERGEEPDAGGLRGRLAGFREARA